jgi:class 3 adenylate cyclase
VIAALDAWFDRIAGAVHAFGGEVLKFIGDGVLAIFPVTGAPAEACEAALRAVGAARAGMAHLDPVRQAQGLPPLPFGAALHLGEILWGNIGAADRLDFRRFEGAGLDGVMAKRLDAPYRAGERTMIKVQHERTADWLPGTARQRSRVRSTDRRNRKDRPRPMVSATPGMSAGRQRPSGWRCGGVIWGPTAGSRMSAAR